MNINKFIDEQVSNYLLENELMNEGVSDIAYHFTNSKIIIEILTNNVFILSQALNSSREEELNRGKLFYISTTRSKSSGFNQGQVKLVLDARKLATRYKFIPVSYFSTSRRHVKGNDEQEDRIISNKRIIPNATSYIKEIHLHYAPVSPHRLRKIIELCDDRDIELSIYRKQEDFYNQQNPIKRDKFKSLLNSLAPLDGEELDNAENYPEKEIGYLLFNYDLAAILSINNTENYEKIKKYIKSYDNYDKIIENLDERISELKYFNFNDDTVNLIKGAISLASDPLSEIKSLNNFLIELLRKEMLKMKANNVNDYIFVKKYNAEKTMTHYKNTLFSYLTKHADEIVQKNVESFFDFRMEQSGEVYEPGYTHPKIQFIMNEMVKTLKKEIYREIMNNKNNLTRITTDIAYSLEEYEKPLLSTKINIFPSDYDITSERDRKMVLLDIFRQMIGKIVADIRYLSDEKIDEFVQEFAK